MRNRSDFMAKTKKKTATVKAQIEIIMAELNSIRSELEFLKANPTYYVKKR